MAHGEHLHSEQALRQNAPKAMREGPVDVQDLDLLSPTPPEDRDEAEEKIAHHHQLEAEGLGLIRRSLIVGHSFPRPKVVAEPVDPHSVDLMGGESLEGRGEDLDIEALLSETRDLFSHPGNLRIIALACVGRGHYRDLRKGGTTHRSRSVVAVFVERVRDLHS